MSAQKRERSPIICDHCSRLALAVFDEHNLCVHCLNHAETKDLYIEDFQPVLPLPITTEEFIEAFGTSKQ